jgi:hypothetical protein
MAAALKEMRMSHSLRDINLQHAVTQAVFAAAITSELPTETVFQQLGGGETRRSRFRRDHQLREGYLGSIAQYAGKAKGLTIDGVRIPHLYPRHEAGADAPGATRRRERRSSSRCCATSRRRSACRTSS